MEEDILNYLSTVMFRGTPCIFDELYVKLSLDTEIYRFKYSHTLKPLITNRKNLSNVVLTIFQ